MQRTAERASHIYNVYIRMPLFEHRGLLRIYQYERNVTIDVESWNSHNAEYEIESITQTNTILRRPFGATLAVSLLTRCSK